MFLRFSIVLDFSLRNRLSLFPFLETEVIIVVLNDTTDTPDHTFSKQPLRLTTVPNTG